MYFNVFEVSPRTTNCVYSKDCHVSKWTGFSRLSERIGVGMETTDCPPVRDM